MKHAPYQLTSRLYVSWFTWRKNNNLRFFLRADFDQIFNYNFNVSSSWLMILKPVGVWCALKYQCKNNTSETSSFRLWFNQTLDVRMYHSSTKTHFLVYNRICLFRFMKCIWYNQWMAPEGVQKKITYFGILIVIMCMILDDDIPGIHNTAFILSLSPCWSNTTRFKMTLSVENPCYFIWCF